MKINDRIVFLRGKRLYLRGLEPSDAERCQRWINEPETRRYLMAAFPTSLAAERKWIENVGLSEKPFKDIVCGIVLNRGDRLIGMIGLHKINWVNRNAVSGMMIGEPECRGKGYGPEAKDLLLGHAFQTLGLHRVSSIAFANNARSLGSLRKSGYREEGRSREAVWRDGAWVDEIQFAILDHEWRARRATT